MRELLSTCHKAGRRDSTEVPLADARQYMHVRIPSIPMRGTKSVWQQMWLCSILTKAERESQA